MLKYVRSVWINAKTKIQSVLLVIIFQWCLSNRSNVKSLVSPESPQQPAFVAQQWRRRRKTSRIVSFFWPWWWKFFLKRKSENESPVKRKPVSRRSRFASPWQRNMKASSFLKSSLTMVPVLRGWWQPYLALKPSLLGCKDIGLSSNPTHILKFDYILSSSANLIHHLLYSDWISWKKSFVFMIWLKIWTLHIREFR